MIANIQRLFIAIFWNTCFYIPAMIKILQVLHWLQNYCWNITICIKQCHNIPRRPMKNAKFTITFITSTHINRQWISRRLLILDVILSITSQRFIFVRNYLFTTTNCINDHCQLLPVIVYLNKFKYNFSIVFFTKKIHVFVFQNFLLLFLFFNT